MIQQGSIILATVADPQGTNHKGRPLVVVSPNSTIANGDPLVAVAITSQFQQPLAPDEIALPYHPAGAARTRLTKPSVAKCSWLCELEQGSVEIIKGHIGGSVLERILTIVNELRESSS